jgi:Tudor domain
LEELLEPVIDEVCATRISGDETYKRAKILSIENGQYHVRFIDYGKTTVTNDFHKLPRSLQEFPPIALQCQYVKTELFTSEESTSSVTDDKYAKFLKHETLYMDIRDNKTQPMTVELLKLTPLLHQKKKRRRECKSPLKEIDDKKLLRIHQEGE